MSDIAPSEPLKKPSPRRALLRAFLICLASQVLIAAFAIPVLDRISSTELKFLLCIFLPTILAFPVLYCSCLLRDMRREARAGLLFLISYAVFGTAMFTWGVFLFAIMLIFGVRI